MNWPFHFLEKLALGRVVVRRNTGAAQKEALKHRYMRETDDHFVALETASADAVAQAAVAATEFNHDITGTCSCQI